MHTFYPGPSKVYPQVRQYLLDAYDSGILSVNHRSGEFMAMCQKTLGLLHEKLNIPAGHTIVFVSSATECWEIIAQSFAGNGQPGFYFHNGSFGKKWFEYARKIHPQSKAFPFGLEESAHFSNISVPGENNVLCFTQNETSNGTQVTGETLAAARREFPTHLIAVDATSSLGGADLRIADADIWFASVQKCLGLPAGLGLLVASPKAVETAEKTGDRRFYNSFLSVRDNILKFQTHCTPNVLAIYLLMRVLESVENVSLIAERLKKQAAGWYGFLEAHPVLKPLVHNPSVRSDTVVAVLAEKEIVFFVKQKARAANIELGSGYGQWKETTFRIANFPAIDSHEIEVLKQVLSDVH